jgi:hypothetical protein
MLATFAFGLEKDRQVTDRIGISFTKMGEISQNIDLG